MGGASATEQTREEQCHEQGLLEVCFMTTNSISIITHSNVPHTCRELLNCFEDLAGDSECRAVVLSGAGKNFSAGWSGEFVLLLRVIQLLTVHPLWSHVPPSRAGSGRLCRPIFLHVHG